MCQSAARCQCSQNFRPVTHVIFDLDGTLTDTEVVYEEIMKIIAAAYGKELPNDLRMKILGTTEQNMAELMTNGLGLPISKEQYLQQYHELCLEKLPNVNLMKGVKRLLCHLKCHAIPFALGTSSSARHVEIKIAKHKELFDMFEHFVCGTSDPEVKQGKPAPDIFLIAASRFPKKPDPSKCLVFEDAPNGVKAANTAGMQVVMVPAATTSVELRKGATLVIDSLEDFKPELFGLPPFPECSN